MDPDKKHYLVNFVLPMIILVVVIAWLVFKR